MDRNPANIPQSTLDLRILKALDDSESYGPGMVRRVELITEGTFKLSPGSLIPAFQRMEEAGV
jgi:PadR family transcriptional regulator, regulatory protein PadR